MARTTKPATSSNTGNRQDQITYLKETCPEGSVLHLIFRGSTQTISVFRLYVDETGQARIECLDLPVSIIMGYKLKDEEKQQGIQVTASQDQEMLGEMLVMALSRYVFSEYNKYTAKWL